MPYNVTLNIIAGTVALPGVAGSVGAVYSEYRTDSPGRGAAVELPAVLALLAAIGTGKITAAQAETALAPFLTRLEEFDREMDRYLAQIDPN
ncbi:hypothetical protein [Streptomyces zaomyceticus]|uniref:hypothetical protein n=1 Tax=Streptomyces zaomyceticus TaxID=68286 RepID=UPI0036BD3FD7